MHRISSRPVAILVSIADTSNPAETERSKMLSGELYSAMDPELVAARMRVRRMFARYNATDPGDVAGRAALLRELLGYVGADVAIDPPYCDYGTQITLGAGVFVNFGAVFLDPAQITVGNGKKLSRASVRKRSPTPVRDEKTTLSVRDKLHGYRECARMQIAGAIVNVTKAAAVHLSICRRRHAKHGVSDTSGS